MTFLVFGAMSSTVYPRVCGVDALFIRFQCLEYGLSPRVRGRSKMSLRRFLDMRFIPACAG